MVNRLPDPILTDSSNAFAHHSMAVRVPSIIQSTIERNSEYPPFIRDALILLREEIIANAPLRLFSAPSPDFDLWHPTFLSKKGETWLHTEWLFAEMLVYRLILDAVHYWTSLRDPFAPFKVEEFESDTLWDTLAGALTSDGSRAERLTHHLGFSLWGNRMDLSLKQAADKGTQAREEHLLANDIPDAVHYLLKNPPGTIHIVMDNAGTEQAVDLALADHLIIEGIARRVILHVKMQPVLVSDAIVADFHTLFDYMTLRSAETMLLANRLRSYIESERLSIVPDFFWNTAGRFWDLPYRILTPFRGASLVICKGDLNYRRVTNDALWPADATLTQAVEEFPAPLLLLRTLKSDTLIGISQTQQTQLDELGEPGWRTSGTYGVAQFAPFGA